MTSETWPLAPELALTNDSSDSPPTLLDGLVRRHSRFVFQIAYAVLQNSEDAEEVVQETFLRLHRHNAWPRIDNPRAYLAKIAWRLALDARKRRRRERPDSQVPERADLRTPETISLDGDTRQRLVRLIDSLPGALRHPLLLSAIEDLNSREIAAVLGLPEGTVRSRILKARALLKSKLQAYGGSTHAV